MTSELLDNREEIQQHLEEDTYLNLYGLGDLDDFMWPLTTWYGLRVSGRLEAVVLVYNGVDLPTVVGLNRDPGPVSDLLRAVRGELPDRFYSHLSPGLETILAESHATETGEPHHKMALTEESALHEVNTSRTARLTTGDVPELQHLFDESYPGNWFDPRMLESGQYFGLRVDGRLVSAAGVHVYSTHYRVAALGNIVTHPEFRSRGFGTMVTAATAQSLLRAGARVGLNVQADNAAAIGCYTKLGFSVVAAYWEYLFSRQS